MFHGNWVDLLISAFILVYVWEGWRRGFIRLSFDLIAFIGAFLISLKIYPYISQLLITYFSLPQGIANAAAFLVVGLGIEQGFSYLFDRLDEKIPKRFYNHKLNYWLSIVPLVGNAFIIIAFFLTLILGLPIRSNIKLAISDSTLAQPIIARTQQLEKMLSGVFGEVITDTFNFVTISPVSHDEVQLNFTQKELTIDETSERDMLARVNKERLSQGLRGLTMDPRLRDLARVYAKDMFERGYFSHYNPDGQSPFDRMDEAGIEYRAAGENLAFAPTVGIAHQGLMDSPGHRANILSADFARIGIGVMDGGVYGKMFVQEFTN